jgi:hypothetical protein
MHRCGLLRCTRGSLLADAVGRAAFHCGAKQRVMVLKTLHVHQRALLVKQRLAGVAFVSYRPRSDERATKRALTRSRSPLLYCLWLWRDL